MAEREALTAEYVRQILHYNSETGVFTWRERPREHFNTDRACNSWNSRYSGTIAGSINCRGYFLIGINNRYHKKSRLAWLYMTGEWPRGEIDHWDTDTTNDRFRNLRDATRSQNQANRRINSNNSSGIKGVSWHNGHRKWRACINKNGKHIHLGWFNMISAAAAAVEQASIALNGEFARKR